jgi:hypothetical protein
VTSVQQLARSNFTLRLYRISVIGHCSCFEDRLFLPAV